MQSALDDTEYNEIMQTRVYVALTVFTEALLAKIIFQVPTPSYRPSHLSAVLPTPRYISTVGAMVFVRLSVHHKPVL